VCKKYLRESKINHIVIYTFACNAQPIIAAIASDNAKNASNAGMADEAR
jgi:hypothetical protein